MREDALRSALVHGSRRADHCVAEWARAKSAPHPLAILLLALLGDPDRQREVLLADLQSASHRDPALFALGYTGQTALVPTLIELMSSEPRVIQRHPERA